MIMIKKFQNYVKGIEWTDNVVGVTMQPTQFIAETMSTRKRDRDCHKVKKPYDMVTIITSVFMWTNLTTVPIMKSLISFWNKNPRRQFEGTPIPLKWWSKYK